MNRRIGVVVLAAVAAALRFRRCSAREESNDVAPAAQAGKVERAVSAKREDPRKLQRASLAGTVTDKATKLPLARAQVCADGWSHDTPSDVFKDPTCVVAEAVP